MKIFILTGILILFLSPAFADCTSFDTCLKESDDVGNLIGYRQYLVLKAIAYKLDEINKNGRGNT